MTNDLVRLPITEVADAAATVFASYGASPEHCGLVFDNLIGADLRGIHTHGIARVQMYVDRLESGAIDPLATAELEYGVAGTSCWDARHAFGQVATASLIDHACDQAKQTGSHIAVVHGSNHFGYAGHWVRRAADRGLMAMAFTSGGPLVNPTGGVRAELGTNPLAFGMRTKGDEVMVDMSTSAVAVGKLELAHRNDKSIPTGWAVDGAGEPLTEPESLLTGMLTGTAGGLVPLGGSGTEHGGHKGYGLGLMVEVLCSVLSGGDDVRIGREGSARFEGHVSHCVIAVDPKHLAGVEPTQRALDKLLAGLRDSPAQDPDSPVMVPGDPERDYEQRAGKGHVFIESSCWAGLTALVEQRS